MSNFDYTAWIFEMQGVFMRYPQFFDDINTITLYDPLSHLLGAFEEGIITFSYLDCVKMAGHSCPTVAGAYLMMSEGLKALYEEKMPIRGEIEVFFKGAKKEGTTGVIANISSFITGACDEGGFKGLNSQYARENLLHFNANVDLSVQLRRKDTQKSIDIAYDANAIAPNPLMMKLMPLCLTKQATLEEQAEFTALWQERVKKILMNPHQVLHIKMGK